MQEQNLKIIKPVREIFIGWPYLTEVLLTRPRLDAYHEDLNKPIDELSQISESVRE